MQYIGRCRTPVLSLSCSNAMAYAIAQHYLQVYPSTDTLLIRPASALVAKTL